MTRRPCWIAIQYNLFPQNLHNNKVKFPAERQVIVLLSKSFLNPFAMATLVKIRVRNFLAELGQKTKVRSDQSLHLERISIEWSKTKTKVITLANQKGRRQLSKPIKTRSNYT